MTRKYQLEPGLELDILIAEKVLGWTPSTWPGLWIDGMCKQNKLSEFSTDIKAAWDLVEKFKLCIVPWGGHWTATKRGQIYIDGERNLAPTAPHAICLAALFYAEEVKQLRGTMSDRIKNWESLITYMQDNPDSILIRNSLLDMPLVLLLDSKRTELYLREPLPFADERLQGNPHTIDGEEVFGMTEFRIKSEIVPLAMDE